MKSKKTKKAEFKIQSGVEQTPFGEVAFISISNTQETISDKLFKQTKPDGKEFIALIDKYIMHQSDGSKTSDAILDERYHSYARETKISDIKNDLVKLLTAASLESNRLCWKYYETGQHDLSEHFSSLYYSILKTAQFWAEISNEDNTLFQLID